jgi:hypothetical protein
MPIISGYIIFFHFCMYSGVYTWRFWSSWQHHQGTTLFFGAWWEAHGLWPMFDTLWTIRRWNDIRIRLSIAGISVAT